MAEKTGWSSEPPLFKVTKPPLIRVNGIAKRIFDGAGWVMVAVASNGSVHVAPIQYNGAGGVGIISGQVLDYCKLYHPDPSGQRGQMRFCCSRIPPGYYQLKTSTWVVSGYSLYTYDKAGGVGVPLVMARQSGHKAAKAKK